MGTAGTVARLHALLPHTECGACGVAGCAAFAEALAEGQLAADACTPGGAWLAQALRRQLGRPQAPTLAEFLAPVPTPQVAVIREADCIGCTKCLPPCPTDAIVGARQTLHGVLVDDCTGCGLCLAPCPVDCIDLQSVATPVPEAAAAARAALARGPEIEACTGCGECAPACPSALAPVPLARALRALDTDAALELGLTRCTACGACDAVCPVAIPLTAHFTHGMTLVAAVDDARRRAAHTDERQAARARRLTRAPTVSRVELVAPPPDRALAAAGVQAALARARARRDA